MNKFDEFLYGVGCLFTFGMLAFVRVTITKAIGCANE
jgi:hypothetical protein